MRIVVVGGGVAGMTLSAILRRLRVPCTVLEKHDSFQSPRNPCVVWANAASAFSAVGMNRFLDKWHGDESFGVTAMNGKWLSRVDGHNVRLGERREKDVIRGPVARTATSYSLVSTYRAENTIIDLGHVPLRVSVPRLDYLNAMKELSEDVRFGCEVESIEPHESGDNLVVNLSSGAREVASCVIGADGLQSTVRKILYPDMPLVGDGVIIEGVAPLSTAARGQGVFETWGNGHCVTIIPLPNSTTYFRVRPNKNDIAMLTDELQNASDLDSAKKVVAGLLTGFHEPIPSVILAAADLDIVPEQQVPILPQWYNRRCGLIGDAAHAVFPSLYDQGDSFAIEDAVAIASYLREMPTQSEASWDYVFNRFQSARQNRLYRYLGYNRQMREVSSYNGASATVRDTLAPLVPSSVFQAWKMHWMTSWTHHPKNDTTEAAIRAEVEQRA